jgi:hypothetical protein
LSLRGGHRRYTLNGTQQESAEGREQRQENLVGARRSSAARTSPPNVRKQSSARLPQPVTTAEARLALATTRPVVITLLEWLDRQGVTLQLADDRRIVRQQPGSP